MSHLTHGVVGDFGAITHLAADPAAVGEAEDQGTGGCEMLLYQIHEQLFVGNAGALQCTDRDEQIESSEG